MKIGNVIFKSLKLKDSDRWSLTVIKIGLYIYCNASYISKHIPKNKPKSYNIPIANPNSNTAADGYDYNCQPL